MVHAPHHTLPNYDERQILHDGCDECERRGEDIELALANMDRETWERAWERAGQWDRGEIAASKAEYKLLRTLAMVRSRLERDGMLNWRNT